MVVRTRVELLAWVVTGLAIAAAVLLCAHRVWLSPAGRVIFQDPAAPWIMVESPVTARLQQWGRTEVPRTRFETRFELPSASDPARIRFRAFGEARVLLNEQALAPEAPPPASWKRFREIDASGRLRPGSNTLRVEVANRHGPALLSLRLEAGGSSVTTGPHWLGVLEDGRPRRTLLASDARGIPDAGLGEKPWPSLVAHRGVVGLLLLLASLVWLAPRELQRRVAGSQRLPSLVLALAAVAWLYLFASKFLGIDLSTGFDAANHLDYVLLLEREGRLPRVAEHWSTYHPPLFYLATAALDGLAPWLGGETAQRVLRKLVPFAAGLGNVWLSQALARRLAPEEPGVWIHATAFAAVLPMNLYVAAYFSNEGLHAFLAGCALLAAVSLLLADEVRPGRLLLLSVLLGLALLTKFTALVVTAPLLAAVGARLVLDAGAPGPLLARGALLVLPMLALCGWFYARNVLEFGRPVVGNWDLPGADRSWWSQPGFHTPGYYLRFGEVLARPYFSGFVSFWDALYSTLWGDGFLGGRAGVRARHGAWNYALMSAGYLLSLPATALLVAGFGRCARDALRGPEPRRRAAVALPVLVFAAMLFAVFFATLGLPFHGQAKASYALLLTPVLAFFFARSYADLDHWLERRLGVAGRALLTAWWVSWLGVLFLSFAA